MADRVAVRLKTERFDSLMSKMAAQAVGREGLVMLALRDVTNDEFIPGVREKTPVKTGKLKAGWKKKREGVKRGRPFIEIINRVPTVIFFEFGTLKRRRKKLKKSTLLRREQKAGRTTRTAKFDRPQRLSGEGGIRPIGMTRKTLREIRVRGSIALAMRKHLKKSWLKAKLETDRIRG